MRRSDRSGSAIRSVRRAGARRVPIEPPNRMKSMNLHVALVSPEIHWNIEAVLTARKLRGIKKRRKRQTV